MRKILRAPYSLTVSERLEFYSIPEPNSGCLLWTGTYLRSGYGQIELNQQKHRAHRLSWEVANGRTIPEGMVVLHKCDVPACINPDHLKIGSQKDNLEDARRKGRMRPNHPGGRLRAQTNQLEA